jgi:protein phosphatase 1L
MGKIKYGIAESRGFRPYMEDAHAIHDEEVDGLFCAEVFDGHTGGAVSGMAAEMLFQFFISFSKESTTLSTGGIPAWFNAESLRRAYHAVDRYAVEHRLEGGAAAAGIAIYRDRFLAANVGDVRIVAGNGSDTVELTLDHKPGLPKERARIEALGGRIITLDQPRVEGSLNMSRALGDVSLKPFVTSEPRIVEGYLGRETDVIVLASDGIWDAVSSSDAIRLAREKDDPEIAAQLICTTASNNGSMDNMTAIVLYLKAYVSSFGLDHFHVTRIIDHTV